MQFDSVKQKKQEKKQKNKKTQRKVNRLTKVYPIAGVTENDYIQIRSRQQNFYAAFFDTQKYDLALLDEKEADFVTETYWDFLKQYASSVKELFLNFPEQNQRQQRYVKYKRDQVQNVHQMQILQTELDKLKFIEKEYKKLASYLIIFGQTESDLEENIHTLYRFSDLFQPVQLDQNYVRKIFYLLNNTGGKSIYGS